MSPRAQAASGRRFFDPVPEKSKPHDSSKALSRKSPSRTIRQKPCPGKVQAARFVKSPVPEKSKPRDSSKVLSRKSPGRVIRQKPCPGKIQAARFFKTVAAAALQALHSEKAVFRHPFRQNPARSRPRNRRIPKQPAGNAQTEASGKEPSHAGFAIAGEAQQARRLTAMRRHHRAHRWMPGLRKRSMPLTPLCGTGGNMPSQPFPPRTTSLPGEKRRMPPVRLRRNWRQCGEGREDEMLRPGEVGIEGAEDADNLSLVRLFA